MFLVISFKTKSQYFDPPIFLYLNFIYHFRKTTNKLIKLKLKLLRVNLFYIIAIIKRVVRKRS